MSTTSCFREHDRQSHPSACDDAFARELPVPSTQCRTISCLLGGLPRSPQHTASIENEKRLGLACGECQDGWGTHGDLRGNLPVSVDHHR